MLIETDFKTGESHSWLALASTAFHLQTQDFAINVFSTGKVYHATVSVMKIAVDKSLGSLTSIYVKLTGLTKFSGHTIFWTTKLLVLHIFGMQINVSYSSLVFYFLFHLFSFRFHDVYILPV